MSLGRDLSLGALGALGFVVGFILLFAAGLGLSFLMGTLFDMFMGTTARPIFMFASIVGITYTGSQMMKENEKSDAGEKAMMSLLGWGILLVLSPLIAMVATWFFSGSVAQFMNMVNYDGSFVGLAFWGTLFAGFIRNIFMIIGLLISAVAR